MDDHHAAARTWFNLGVASDSPEESEQAYFRSLELYPEYELPVANLGLLLTKTGQLQKAIEFLQPKVDAGIDWPRTAILLSTAYRLNNEQDLAVAILRKIVESNDQSMEHMEMAWEILVRCLVESENDEEAVSRCKEWKAKMPESAVAEHMLAAIVGKDAPSRASSKYVADTFDSFAESFDSVLTNLEYCAPHQIPPEIPAVL
jgi:Flp pilus assembly protein TadD